MPYEKKQGTLATLLPVFGMLRTTQRHPGNTMTGLSHMKIHHAITRFLFVGRQIEIFIAI